MLSVWCLVPGNYPTARRLRPLRSLIEDRTIAEKSIDLILSRYLNAEASLPKNSTGLFGCTVSGVSTPISLTVSERPLYSIFIVSPSTTFKTRYGFSPEKFSAGYSNLSVCAFIDKKPKHTSRPNTTQIDFIRICRFNFILISPSLPIFDLLEAFSVLVMYALL